MLKCKTLPSCIFFYQRVKNKSVLLGLDYMYSIVIPVFPFPKTFNLSMVVHCSKIYLIFILKTLKGKGVLWWFGVYLFPNLLILLKTEFLIFIPLYPTPNLFPVTRKIRKTDWIRTGNSLQNWLRFVFSINEWNTNFYHAVFSCALPLVLIVYSGDTLCVQLPTG